MRSGTGTKSGVPSRVTRSTKALIACFGAVSFQDGSGSSDANATLPKVATEMSLNVLAYNMKRVMNIIGVDKLLEAMRAVMAKARSKSARAHLLQDAIRGSQGAIWDRIAAKARKNRLGATVLAS
mgnify:CR=1 FL=1